MSSAERALWVGAMLMGLSSQAAATVFEVNAGAACPGSGTTQSPYCAIGSAAAIAAPGDTVNVAAGIYREQVTPANSGEAGRPITYHGAPDAKIYGTSDLSGAARWTLSSGTTYATPYNPPSAPAQVFVDEMRLTASTTGAGAVPVNGFFYDAIAHALYVNLGGDNPGSHAVEAGARSLGFNVDGKSHLVIEGFEARGQNTSGIRVRSSSNVVVRGNRVLRAASFGLVADGTTVPTTTGPVEISGNEVLENGDGGIRLRTNVFQATVSRNVSHHNLNHGLSVSNTTASVFANNTFHANAKPGGVSTTGMLLAGDSDGNRVERNLAYENQDSGFQVSGGADGNVLVRNISFANGDHGFDVRECDGPRLVSNTSTGNFNDGFSIEGNVTNATLRNNIAAENSLTTDGNELWVDTTSTAGFSSDYDIFWRSSASRTVEYNGGVYATLDEFARATGHEAHGIGANPSFANPVADDFHPGLGPAIDSADAGATGFQALDFDGIPPIDVPGVTNTGAGVPNYADRGALEGSGDAPPVDAPPVAQLTVTPGRPVVGEPVTADGSASSDDTGIVSYRFEWGDGSPITVQDGPVARHVFLSAGAFTVKLTVTDEAGQTGSIEKVVQVGIVGGLPDPMAGLAAVSVRAEAVSIGAGAVSVRVGTASAVSVGAGAVGVRVGGL